MHCAVDDDFDIIVKKGSGGGFNDACELVTIEGNNKNTKNTCRTIVSIFIWKLLPLENCLTHL